MLAITELRRKYRLCQERIRVRTLQKENLKKRANRRAVVHLLTILDLDLKTDHMMLRHYRARLARLAV